MANVLMKEFPVIVLRNRIMVVVSLCVTVILLFLQPFSFGFYQQKALISAFGYGIITFMGIYIFNTLIKKRILKLLSKWIVVYEIGFIFSLILFIATLNFVFTAWMGAVSLKVNSYLSWVNITFSVGIFPTIFAVMYVRYRSVLETKVDEDKNIEPEQRMITIRDMASSTKLAISPNDFVYAEIRCSTLYVYFMHDDILRERHFRATINSIENEVCDDKIVRCHRSFIVNVKYVDAMEGNSNGYKLYLKCSNTVIPVSRRYTLLIRNLLDEYAIAV